MNYRSTVVFVLLVACVFALAGNPTSAQEWKSREWKFGVMADTQWPSSPDNKNPSGTAIDIVNHLNNEFIRHRVRFVIEVGDLTDAGSADVTELDARATFAQALYNAGIGFYPLRGNHESAAVAAQEFVRVFPQTRDGWNNRTPSDAFVIYPLTVPLYPVAPQPVGSAFRVGRDFASPTGIDPNYAGLSYSFDYENARFVLLDTFSIPNVACNLLENQQPWITATLQNRPDHTHAFVFGHKGLITENHTDILFTAPGKCDGSSSASNPSVKLSARTQLQRGVRGCPRHGPLNL